MQTTTTSITGAHTGKNQFKQAAQTTETPPNQNHTVPETGRKQNRNQLANSSQLNPK